ncbi:hypothetical protein L3X38_041253 [Prunus dulcis]|uniref:Uncharacterized protein n=1 Tax=Prunus dulcis TaxID=3755 RepID=A0AAD4USN0_PRUDU|nr:hypothetical protein L3X38_041253 [Prunus dulcis]
MKKLHTRAHPSYPSFYSRSGSLHSTTGRSNSDGSWLEFHFEIRPKPRFTKSVSTQQIDPNLCISHLELGKEEESSPQSPGLGGRDGGATMESLWFEPVEIIGDSRVFRLGDLVILVQGFTTSRTGPVSRAGVVGCGGVRWFPSP